MARYMSSQLHTKGVPQKTLLVFCQWLHEEGA